MRLNIEIVGNEVTSSVTTGRTLIIPTFLEKFGSERQESETFLYYFNLALSFQPFRVHLPSQHPLLLEIASCAILQTTFALLLRALDAFSAVKKGDYQGAAAWKQ